jgi:hypothetical protein
LRQRVEDNAFHLCSPAWSSFAHRSKRGFGCKR